jgi:dihydrofolate reductase
MGAAVEAGMQDMAALLMGRKLYEEWFGYWTTTKDQGTEELARLFNSARKYVLSNSTETAEWNNTTLVSGDSEKVASQLRRIKDETEGNIQISGSATTVRWLLANGLLDELHLLVHPIVVGKGQRLFEETSTHKLTLTKSETFKSGVLNLTYVPETD